MEKKQEEYVSNFQKDLFTFAGNHQAFSYLCYVSHTGGILQKFMNWKSPNDLELPDARCMCKHFV